MLTAKTRSRRRSRPGDHFGAVTLAGVTVHAHNAGVVTVRLQLTEPDAKARKHALQCPTYHARLGELSPQRGLTLRRARRDVVPDRFRPCNAEERRSIATSCNTLSL